MGIEVARQLLTDQLLLQAMQIAFASSNRRPTSSTCSHVRSSAWIGTLSGSASGDSINTWIVNFIEHLLVRAGGQFAQCTINLPSVKPVRVVVTETVRFFIIEFVHEVF